MSSGDKPGAEALSGLARAFFYAGAKSLVVSNGEVDSDATVELMDRLFDALKANPRFSHAEALQESMLRMIANSAKPEWAQPQFWAPFVVVFKRLVAKGVFEDFAFGIGHSLIYVELEFPFGSLVVRFFLCHV